MLADEFNPRSITTLSDSRPDQDKFTSVRLSEKPGAVDRFPLWISHNTWYESAFLIYIALHNGILIDVYFLGFSSELHRDHLLS